jgi:dihydroxyacetone kinase
MLSAAVAREIFTSPSSDSVFAAIKATAGEPGALLVVKNYTGDRLNFGVAAEMARAEGIAVETVVVNDDVALKGAEQATGARGLAGTVLIHKLVGSLATMGLPLSAGTSPAVGKPSFELGEDEMELGLGIHGEPGVKRTQLQSVDKLTETLLGEILKYRNFGEQRRVALMVNNLGATTEMEIAIVARHAVPFLESKGYTVERIYAGTFLSSLDMAGISVSVLGVNDERLGWLDAPTTAPAWPNVPKGRPGKAEARIATGISAEVSRSVGDDVRTKTGRKVERAIEAACKALIDAEEELTEMDRATGDGDLGASMRRAAMAVQSRIDSYPLNNVSATLKALGHLLQREMGGSSGPLYGVLFLRCGNVLESSRTSGLAQWAEAVDQGRLCCGRSYVTFSLRSVMNTGDVHYRTSHKGS